VSPRAALLEGAIRQRHDRQRTSIGNVAQHSNVITLNDRRKVIVTESNFRGPRFRAYLASNATPGAPKPGYARGKGVCRFFCRPEREGQRGPAVWVPSSLRGVSAVTVTRLKAVQIATW
jgi:hypothetical protein